MQQRYLFWYHDLFHDSLSTPQKKLSVLPKDPVASGAMDSSAETPHAQRWFHGMLQQDNIEHGKTTVVSTALQHWLFGKLWFLFRCHEGFDGTGGRAERRMRANVIRNTSPVLWMFS